MFTLHPQLAADTLEVGDFPLCTVRLMNDSSYPWLILVPKRQAIREITDLPAPDVETLWGEILRAHEALKGLVMPDKMNIGAIGNMVPQLHVHVVARMKGDKAWPKPVWGFAPAVPYTPDAAAERIAALRAQLGL